MSYDKNKKGHFNVNPSPRNDAPTSKGTTKISKGYFNETVKSIKDGSDNRKSK